MCSLRDVQASLIYITRDNRSAKQLLSMNTIIFFELLGYTDRSVFTTTIKFCILLT